MMVDNVMCSCTSHIQTAPDIFKFIEKPQPKLSSKQHIQLNYHRITTSLTKNFHWLLSALSVCRLGDVIGDVVRDDGNEVPLPPQPLCLHSLLYDDIPYWGQIVPSTIPIEARVQGSNENGLVYPFFWMT